MVILAKEQRRQSWESLQDWEVKEAATFNFAKDHTNSDNFGNQLTRIGYEKAIQIPRFRAHRIHDETLANYNRQHGNHHKAVANLDIRNFTIWAAKVAGFYPFRKTLRAQVETLKAFKSEFNQRFLAQEALTIRMTSTPKPTTLQTTWNWGNCARCGTLHLVSDGGLNASGECTKGCIIPSETVPVLSAMPAIDSKKISKKHWKKGPKTPTPPPMSTTGSSSGGYAPGGGPTQVPAWGSWKEPVNGIDVQAFTPRFIRRQQEALFKMQAEGEERGTTSGERAQQMRSTSSGSGCRSTGVDTNNKRDRKIRISEAEVAHFDDTTCFLKALN